MLTRLHGWRPLVPVACSRLLSAAAAAAPADTVVEECPAGPSVAAAPNHNAGVIPLWWYSGITKAPLSEEIRKILNEAPPVDRILVTEWGLPYASDSWVRDLLNRAFGVGGWGILRRPDFVLPDKHVYGLFAQSRFLAESIVGADWSQAAVLLRCAKKLGVGAAVDDPAVVRSFRSNYCTQEVNLQGKKVWRLKKAADY
eukprot:gnl/Spiro4/27945_TR13835_c0_g1_i1.p2 gnl/Spiro4/27945_TR13835_c0_g1~~gnl/Spiro4/27945_TR13835_c0_g1_i1.p2  ORF type:complete len:209 (-),score=53.03 gnl/Spiro4/27945_TR13835_c0_g1_i1:13-609(-)